jgi:hypothetical protein
MNIDFCTCRHIQTCVHHMNYVVLVVDIIQYGSTTRLKVFSKEFFGLWSSTWAVLSLYMSSFNLEARCELISSGVWHVEYSDLALLLPSNEKSIHLDQLIFMRVIIAQWRMKWFTILDLIFWIWELVNLIWHAHNSWLSRIIIHWHKQACVCWNSVIATILQYTPSPK